MGKAKIVAVIPARGGSKGVPGKNIREIAGKPLIAHSIGHAKASKKIGRVIVSSDDDKILKIAEEFGAETLKRPSEFATDVAPSIVVYKHTLQMLEKEGSAPELIVALQPTSPIRDPEDIDRMVEKLIASDADCIMSVCELEHPIEWAYEINREGFLEKVIKNWVSSRQAAPKRYRPNGSIFVMRAGLLKKGDMIVTEKTIPYIMPKERSIDIDDEFDFKVAELVMEHGLAGPERAKTK
jgi:CMP-N,N'-diacetyllegionaminic acid synthase